MRLLAIDIKQTVDCSHCKEPFVITMALLAGLMLIVPVIVGVYYFIILLEAGVAAQ